MNFVQNNFYGTQHPSGKFSKNILHFCQVIKKLSLIIYTLLEWATDYTYTSIINGLQNNLGLFLKSQNWVLTCISIYAMDFYREITQDIVMFHTFYSINNSIKE